jgi:hypothetical protein
MPNEKITLPPKKTEEELKQFVKDVCFGKVWVDQLHTPPSENPTTPFMGLLLTTESVAHGKCKNKQGEEMSPEEVERTQKDFLTMIENTGCCYEYLDKQMGRTINGMPSFLTYHLLHKDDWARVAPVIIKRIQEDIEIPPEKTDGP